MSPVHRPAMTVASLFSGIGGLEHGLSSSGHRADFLCEIMPAAIAVLKQHFPNCRIATDVRTLRKLPVVDLITAGFPCQDLSQAGRTKGMTGSESSLVSYIFDLIRRMPAEARPSWIVLENVPFMLQLNKGHAMAFISSSLSKLGYTWAYRIVDARSFGLPQRRRRVIIVASNNHDPREVILSDDAGGSPGFNEQAEAHGFYWTEGNTGLGWTNDGVPTLKGGSGIGIASPPAIWLRDANAIVTPDVRDAERLQGFPENWTKPSSSVDRRQGTRWKLIGNAVSVPMSKWIGRKLINPSVYDGSADSELKPKEAWPSAAWSQGGKIFRAVVSEWPKQFKYRSLKSFLRYPVQLLSERATEGFFKRLKASSLHRPLEFDLALEEHLKALRR